MYECMREECGRETKSGRKKIGKIYCIVTSSTTKTKSNRKAKPNKKKTQKLASIFTGEICKR